jgi:hypothetical protein
MVMDLAERELVAELAERAGNPHQPFGLYALGSDDPAAEVGRTVEREVFFEYFGNTREFLAHEYDPYEAGSVYLLVVDHARLVAAGVLRLIMPTPFGLKTLHDLERVWGEDVDDVLERTGLSFDMDRIWDVSTIAVRPDYRGSATDGLISASCLQGVIQVGHSCDVQYFVTTLDMVVLKLVQDLCNRPLSMFRGVEPMRYLDSPASVPLYLDVAGYSNRLRAEDPATAHIFVEGGGFEEAMSTPDWSTVEHLASRTRALFA